MPYYFVFCVWGGARRLLPAQFARGYQPVPGHQVVEDLVTNKREWPSNISVGGLLLPNYNSFILTFRRKDGTLVNRYVGTWSDNIS
jgi:hypothetical protein